jgi:hypothetical protein
MGFYDDYNDSIKIINEVKEVDSNSLIIAISIIVSGIIIIYFFKLLFPKIFENQIAHRNSLKDKRYIPYQAILSEVKKVRMLARKINNDIKSNKKYNTEDLKEFGTYYDLIENCLTTHHLIISEHIRDTVHGLKTDIIVFHEAINNDSQDTDINKYFNSIEDTYQKVLKSTKKELGTLN